MTVTVAHIVPDTNQALHYKRLDQIDWPKLVNAKKCIIHISPVYLRELETQKVHNRSKRLRDRAASSILFIASLIDRSAPIEIRKHVELRFIDHEPIIDWKALRLSQSIADDVLIATALEIAAEQDEPVFVSSGDTGVRMKLRSRSEVTFLEIPSEYRLPDEEDSDERELKRIRSELLQLQTRQPKLVVRMPDGNEFTTVIVRRSALTIPTLQEIREKHPLLGPDGGPKDLPFKSPLDAQFRDALRGRSQERHNRLLEEYYSKYERYLQESSQWHALWQRLFKAGFVIHNEGRAPACNVEVVFDLPEKVSAILVRDLPKVPRAPEPPARDAAIAMAFGNYGRDLSPITPFIPDINTDGKPYVSDNRVEYSVRNLKHEFSYGLDDVIFVFDEGVEPHSFSLSYRAHCDETDSVQGEINFKVEIKNQ